jgi:microcompartment protein CcmK/EutM
MRLAWVQGRVTLSRKLDELKPGSLLICEALDEQCLAEASQYTPRKSPMPESLVVFDHLGAGIGDLIAVSEGGEATQPFRPDKVPIDAYNAAIIDRMTIA